MRITLLGRTLGRSSMAKRRGFGAVAALSLAVTLAACGGSSGATDETLTIASAISPSTLNPATAAYGPASLWIQLAYEPLIRQKPDGTLVPALAESWKFTDGKNMRLELKLRSDAKFSDGTPVDAEAVVGSLTYVLEAKGTPGGLLTSIDTIEAVDDTTVAINLRQPNGDLPAVLTQGWNAGQIISPAGVKDPERLKTESLGAGPYVLKKDETVTNSSYTYEPNPNYYDEDAVQWDEVTVKVMADPGSALQALQAGQVDVINATPDQAESAAGGRGSLKIASSMGQNAGFLFLDRVGESAKALADVRVRQALNYAVDREAITEAIWGEFGEATSGWYAEGMPGYSEKSEQMYFYDPDKAKALLAEAGFAGGFTFKATLLNSAGRDLMAQAVASQLAEIGVKLEVSTHRQTNEWQAELFSKQVGLLASTFGFGPPSLTYERFAVNNYNIFGTNDPELAKIVDKAQAASEGESDALWADVTESMLETGYLIPVARTQMIWLSSSDVDVEAPGAIATLDPNLIFPAK